MRCGARQGVGGYRWRRRSGVSGSGSGVYRCADHAGGGGRRRLGVDPRRPPVVLHHGAHPLCDADGGRCLISVPSTIGRRSSWPTAPAGLGIEALGTPLPERVAGSDLIFHLCAEAARQGFRVFLLGGDEGVADEAGRRLAEKYAGLQIVGTECPPFRQPTPEEEEAMIDRIRGARPDLLLVAFGQPKGERWIIRHIDRLGVPVSVQVGASLDFVAGRVRRAPRWMQKSGLEWAFRLSLEPRRLFALCPQRLVRRPHDRPPAGRGQGAVLGRREPCRTRVRRKPGTPRRARDHGGRSKGQIW